MKAAASPSPYERGIKLRDFTKKRGLRKITQRVLDCKRCGLEDKFVLHAWTCFILFDSFGKTILFSTNFFGHYTTRRGLTSIYSVIYMSIAIAAIYTWYLLDPYDSAYKLVWLVRFHMFTLGAAIVCYGIDGILFVLDEKMFCTL